MNFKTIEGIYLDVHKVCYVGKAVDGGYTCASGFVDIICGEGGMIRCWFDTRQIAERFREQLIKEIKGEL